MSNIVSANKLLYFKAEKYTYTHQHTFDTSTSPRPHFCLGLVLRGHGEFVDCGNKSKTSLDAGDIIFIPMGSTYVSEWSGDPDVCYISAHFIFDRQSIFADPTCFSIQKVSLQDTREILRLYTQMFEQFNDDSVSQLGSLGAFFNILNTVLPNLRFKTKKISDGRLQKALEFIEQNFSGNITVDQLAAVCQMSLPRFYPKFKAEFGITPVEYINQYRITRSIVLLMNSNITVEDVSEQVGFESASYFRRVFKKTTGCSPRDFRKISIEL